MIHIEDLDREIYAIIKFSEEDVKKIRDEAKAKIDVLLKEYKDKEVGRRWAKMRKI